VGIKRLRNHIPVGGLSTREPVDGTESPFRVSLGFAPAWYYERCDVAFTERWHTDPYYRFEKLKVMKAELKKQFPSVPYWDSSNREATISGIYGIGIIPGAFGKPILYAPDRWPTLDSQHKLSVEGMEKLEVDQALNSPLVENIFRQMDIIEREWGMIFGYPNWQGVLNSAFNLRGEEIYLDMYDKPELVHRFLNVITEAMIRLCSMVEERQRASGFHISLISVSNCVVNMISPQQYEEFVYPCDLRIAEAPFDRFGMHTCEWDVTPYIDVIKKLPRLGYLDMGMMSDMHKVKKTFPDTNRAVLYSPDKLKRNSLELIREHMAKIYNELGPCDLVMPDVDPDTPDERVRELLSICGELAEGGQAA
jgi:hypothetical protein